MRCLRRRPVIERPFDDGWTTLVDSVVRSRRTSSAVHRIIHFDERAGELEMIVTTETVRSRNGFRSDMNALPMPRIASWLEPQEIVLDAELRDRRHALESAAAAIGRRHGLGSAPIFRSLWRRELLALVAQMFSDRDFRSRVASATDIAELRGAFADWAGQIARPPLGG
jgi:hypothetical protein